MLLPGNTRLSIFYRNDSDSLKTLLGKLRYWQILENSNRCSKYLLRKKTGDLESSIQLTRRRWWWRRHILVHGGQRQRRRFGSTLTNGLVDIRSDDCLVHASIGFLLEDFVNPFPQIGSVFLYGQQVSLDLVYLFLQRGRVGGKPTNARFVQNELVLEVSSRSRYPIEFKNAVE